MAKKNGKVTLVSISTFLYLCGVICSCFLVKPVDFCSNAAISQAPFDLIVENNLVLTILLIFGFGVLTTTNLLLNGFLAGGLVKSATACMSTKEILLLTIPHGIFEIPAIIIAGAAGFKIPYEVVRYLLGRKETILTKEDLKEYLKLALTSIILIVIAAWIEANVTLKIAKAMLNSKKY